MKLLRLLPLLLAVGILAGACSDDELAPTGDDNETATVATTDNGDGTFTTVVDAGYLTATEWIYVDLEAGTQVTPADPAASTEWDLAFKFANIILNGGANGSGAAALHAYDDGAFATLATAPETVYLTDTGTGDAGQAFNAGTGWYDYDPISHAFAIRPDRYYAIRRADGSYIKLKMIDFVDGAGTPGFPTFVWAPIAGDFAVATALAGAARETVIVAAPLGSSDWVYFSLATGLAASPADPANADDYDLALNFANIRLNGGTNGTGGVGLVAFDDTGYAALATAPAAGYISDTGTGDSGLAFNTGSGWYTYDFMTHTMNVNADRYYAIAGADGRHYKLRVNAFHYESGVAAHLKLEWEPIAAP
ncbi:hypothetical protein FJ251_02440 [bacterium]|nr:hypothetical protein [bacterium]